MMVEATLQSARRRRQRQFYIALLYRKVTNQVRVVLLVQDGATVGQSQLGIDDHRQRLDLDRYQFGCVFGEIAALGKNDRDSLPHMPHLVVSEQRLLGIEKFVLNAACPFPG